MSPMEQPTMQTNATPDSARHDGAKNFFLYFVTFALLYTTATSLGGALFAIINRTVADPGFSYGSGGLRYHLSALIIGTPIFLWLSWFLQKHAATDATLRTSGVRRWLTYITLVVAALIVIGDLIALVYSVLGGETTLRFILKALVVLVIAAAVFYYYLTDAKRLRETLPATSLPRMYFIGTAVAALAVIIAGFFFIDSPVQQRLIRQDQERINSISQVEQAITNYYLSNQALPASLDMLNVIQGVTNDPISGEPFEYEVTSANSFRLCATFGASNRTPSKDDPAIFYDPYGGQYLHDAGRSCFERRVELTGDTKYPQLIPVR